MDIKAGIRRATELLNKWGLLGGLFFSFIVAIVALVMGEDSVDSAKAVFWAALVIFASILVSLLVSRFLPGFRGRSTLPDDDDTQSLQKLPSEEEVQQRIDVLLEKQAVVDHDKLFGVTEYLDSIRDLLSDSTTGVISLFGEGGIGKTAVAYEAVKRFAARAGYQRIAWVSTRQVTDPTRLGPVDEQEVRLQLLDLVKKIAEQLEILLDYSQTRWLDDFREKLRKLSAHEKCLIVVDNIESVDYAKGIVEYFDPPTERNKRIIFPHKLLITTRRSVLRYSASTLELSMNGLLPAQAHEFIRSLGRGDSSLRRISIEDVAPILEATEGNPYLIKIVVRRYLVAKLEIPRVLEELRELQTGGIGADLRGYLYVQSMLELEQQVGTDSARHLINAFCPRSAGEQLTYDEFQRSSALSDKNQFEEARRVACDLALVRVSGSSDRHMYSIHSLLREFVCRNTAEIDNGQ